MKPWDSTQLNIARTSSTKYMLFMSRRLIRITLEASKYSQSAKLCSRWPYNSTINPIEADSPKSRLRICILPPSVGPILYWYMSPLMIYLNLDMIWCCHGYRQLSCTDCTAPFLSRFAVRLWLGSGVGSSIDVRSSKKENAAATACNVLAPSEPSSAPPGWWDFVVWNFWSNQPLVLVYIELRHIEEHGSMYCIT